MADRRPRDRRPLIPSAMRTSGRGSHSTNDLSGRHAVVVNWRDLEHSRSGGAERYAWEVARSLIGAGVRVEFLTARERGQARRELREGVTLTRVGGRITFLPRALLCLAQARRRLDLVIDADCGLPAFSPLVLSRRRTAVVLVVHHVHQNQFGVLPRPLAGVARALERRLMPRVYRHATTVAVSESTHTEMRAQLGWTGPVTVIPNGTDAPPEDSPRSEGERIVILGRLSSHKRVDLAIRAVVALQQRRPGLGVDVVGDGPERIHLRDLIAGLGATAGVRLHGRVSEAAKHELLAAACLHLCASEAEGWGQVVLEAAAHGVPTVARDVPGLRDSVRPGSTGWLVADSTDDQITVDALAAALDVALLQLGQAARRTEVAQACRSWAGQFTWAATHRAFAAVSADAIAQVVPREFPEIRSTRSAPPGPSPAATSRP